MKTSQILHCSGPDDVLLPRILSFLSWDVLVLTIRLVNQSWKQAVTYTYVDCFPCPIPTRYFGKIAFIKQLSILLDEARLAKLIETLPRLQKMMAHGEISEDSLRLILNGLRELKSLDIHCPKPTPNDLSYLPETMTSLSCLDSLVELNVAGNSNVKIDLEQLSKLSRLEILHASGSSKIFGNFCHFLNLKELQVCDLEDCPSVRGHVRDLATTADKLLYLGLRGTNVDGRLMDLQKGDYTSLIYLDWIHGGSRMEQQEAEQGIAVDMEGTIRDIFLGKGLALVSSAPLAVQRVFDLAEILPSLRLDLCSFQLSKESPDYYTKPNRSSNGLWSRNPPLRVELIQIQNIRRGWRWTNGTKKGVCDVQWIEPVPEYLFEMNNKKQLARYYLDLQLLNGNGGESIYQGWSNPPTEEEHNDLMYKKLIEKRRRARRQLREEG